MRQRLGRPFLCARRRAVLLAVMAGSAVIGAVRSGQAAAAEPIPVSLRYEPPDGCPARRVVVEQLAARGVRVDAGDTSDRLSIEVHAVPNEATSLRGELVVEAPNRAPAWRRAVGQD